MALDKKKVAVTTKLMTDARAAIVKENPFFGSLSLSLKLGCAPCGTACTDGTYLVFDPDFADKLTEREMMFVILHEVLHCALKHCTRGQTKHHTLYNIACDIVVNSMILEMWGLDEFTVDKEQVMHKTPAKEEGRLFSSEEVYQMLLADCDTKDGSAYANSLIDNHELWGNDEQANGQIADKWTKNILQASKAAGKCVMPMSVRKWVDTLEKENRVNWKELLHDFLQYNTYDYSFIPPDRRFSDADFLLPGFNLYEDAGDVQDIWICVDTSGSISQKEISGAMLEILDAMNQVGLKGKLSFFDDEITEPVPFVTIDDVKNLTPMGNGGTDFSCIFKHMMRMEERPKAILIFTDGYADCPEEEEAMGVPVFWLVTKNGKKDHLSFGVVAQF